MVKKSNTITNLSLLSILVNTLLFIIKLIVGISNNSSALIADAWHTLGDTLSSIAVIIGNKMSSKPADKQHPFGHARYELVITFVISGMLIFVSGNFLIESFKNINSNNSHYTLYFVYASVISILFKEFLAQLTLHFSKKLNSSMLKADAYHHRSDAISSVVLIVGYFLRDYVPYIDQILTIIISIFILKVAIEIIKDNSSKLLGEDIPYELKQKIIDITEELFGSSLEIHHFHYHDYLSHKELSFHIIIDEKMILSEAHQIATILENEIKIKLDIDCTIHMEPFHGSIS